MLPLPKKEPEEQTEVSFEQTCSWAALARVITHKWCWPVYRFAMLQQMNISVSFCFLFQRKSQTNKQFWANMWSVSLGSPGWSKVGTKYTKQFSPYLDNSQCQLNIFQPAPSFLQLTGEIGKSWQIKPPIENAWNNIQGFAPHNPL